MALGKKPIEIVNEGKHQLLVKAKHWDRIFLREVAKVQNGFAFSSKYFVKTGGYPLIRIRDIDNISTVDQYKGEYSDEYVVRKGDILIGMDGDFNAAIWKGNEALLNQRVCRVIPFGEKYDTKFLYLCLQPYLNAINEETSSVTVKHLSSRTIEEIPLPYPSLIEQQGIVSKIEELFSELDKGVEQLKTAQQQLKTYRQSVLKWAFEGRLTNDDVQDGELPEGWKWRSIKEICDTKRKCSYGVLVPGEHVENGITLLRVGDIDDNGKIAQKDMKKISPAIAAKFKRTFLEGGEVVISLVGAIGRTAVVPVSLKGANTARAVGVIPVSKDISANFIELMLRSPDKIKEHNDSSHEVARKTLNLEDVVKSKIPIPSIDEQNEIVQAVESRFSVADKLEESINQSLQQAEALRQSILKQAFEGKLVTETVKPAAFKPKKEYFHQCQILAYIIRASQKNKVDHGEMTLAKYAYLADRLYDIPTCYTYGRWHLGPYAIEMKKAINKKEFFTRKNNSIEIAEGEKLFQYHNPYGEQTAAAIDELAQLFSRYKGKERSHKTELLATVCKVIEDTKTTDLPTIRQSMKDWPINLENEPAKNKAEKFTEEETRKCIAFIVERGWDDKLIRHE